MILNEFFNLPQVFEKETDEGIFGSRPSPVLPVVDKIAKVASGLTPQNVETGKQIIQANARDITRMLNPQVKAGVDVIEQGVAEDSTAHDCKHCNGKGYHTVTKKDGTKVATNCPQCKGKGYIVTKGVAEGVDIGQEWMSDTELDQYVPDQLQQQWRELLGYDRNGNPSALWVNLTGGYEPDVRDPEHRALMVKVANKWFAAKKIPNVKFFDVKDADDELEWLVQIGQQGVAEAIPLDTLRSTAGTRVKDEVSAKLKQNGPLGRDAEKAKQNGKPVKPGVAEGKDDYVPPKEANYDDKYQAMVKRVGEKARAQEKAKQQPKTPVRESRRELLRQIIQS
jgi:hypothetical protein